MFTLVFDEHLTTGDVVEPGTPDERRAACGLCDTIRPIDRQQRLVPPHPVPVGTVVP